MSLVVAVGSWIFLALTVLVTALVAGVLGYLYGRIARRSSGLSAARGARILSVVVAVVVGIACWVLVGATTGESAFVPDHAIAGPTVAAVGSSLTAAVVGAVAFGGVVYGRSDLPGVETPRSAAGRTLRYLTAAFLIAFLGVTAFVPLIRQGVGGVLVTLVIGLAVIWVLAPLFGMVNAKTRSPTDEERDRLETVLANLESEPRMLRINAAGGEAVSIGAYGVGPTRSLFVSNNALSAFDDETLRALVAFNLAQPRHRAGKLGVVFAAVTPLIAALDGPLSVGMAVLASAVVLLVGLAALRRFQLRIDARVGTSVGHERLATAFERAYEAAEISIDERRHLLSTQPAMATRLERLRDARTE